MLASLATEIAALPRLRVSELRAKFIAVFGEPTPSHNKVWQVKRIAWRLQAQAEGDLSERARRGTPPENGAILWRAVISGIHRTGQGGRSQELLPALMLVRLVLLVRAH